MGYLWGVHLPGGGGIVLQPLQHSGKISCHYEILWKSTSLLMYMVKLGVFWTRSIANIFKMLEINLKRGLFAAGVRRVYGIASHHHILCWNIHIFSMLFLLLVPQSPRIQALYKEEERQKECRHQSAFNLPVSLSLNDIKLASLWKRTHFLKEKDRNSAWNSFHRVLQLSHFFLIVDT